MKQQQQTFYQFNTIVVGSGAAGLNAALRLYELGQKSVAIVTEGLRMGTSRNTGSDKQTYYKLSLSGEDADSVQQMAQTLFDGGCVDGDIALAEAAGSARAFYHLVELGVPFPTNASGEYIGYKTDHDPMRRGTSAGPYTSRYMTEALERQVIACGIPIFDKHLVVRLLVSGEGAERRAAGVVALNQAALGDASQRLTLFSATNVIWATGGEAGMYLSSVYPHGQSGGTGVLFEAGAPGKNLTESQYGIASTLFRWNLSGSFQQCLPRYVSTDASGGDEREFLQDAFSSKEKMLEAVFLKGYQWPFDPRKARNEGSSYIDLLVYQEEVIRGRKVYLDFTRNPASLERGGLADFSALSAEAYAYLRNCGALQGSPYERLLRINPQAIRTYLDHGIDLSREKIQVSICAQHNNGGIAANAWWESEIRHLFPVGEVNGSHGVYRPGGTALNAGQVGGLRAAQYILHHYGEAPAGQEAFLAAHKAQIEEVARFASEAVDTPDGTPVDVAAELHALRARMTRYGACIRSREGIATALRENSAQYDALQSHHALADCRRLPDLFRLMELLTAQFTYLSAIGDYIEQIGVSRSSYLVYNEKGCLPHEGLDKRFCNICADTDMTRLQEIWYDAKTRTCKIAWRPVRPLQAQDRWFETAWQKFQSGEAFS